MYFNPTYRPSVQIAKDVVNSRCIYDCIRLTLTNLEAAKMDNGKKVWNLLTTTFSYTIENFSTLNACQESPQNDIWTLNLCPKQIENDEEYVGLYLMCEMGKNSSFWSFEVEVEFRLLRWDGGKPYTNKFNHLFCEEENDWGISDFITREHLLDPESGYIKNDAIKVEAYVRVINALRPAVEEETYDSGLEDLKSDFHELYTKEVLFDFIIKTSDQEFKVHKAVLAARSSVFAAMLVSDMIEKQEGCLTIEDHTTEVMKELIRFLYTSQIDEKFTNFTDLFVAAEKYDVSHLQKLCEVKMRQCISFTNVFVFFIHSDRYGLQKLKKSVIEFILSNKKQIVNHPEFKEFCSDHADLAVEIIKQMV